MGGWLRVGWSLLAALGVDVVVGCAKGRWQCCVELSIGNSETEGMELFKIIRDTCVSHESTVHWCSV